MSKLSIKKPNLTHDSKPTSKSKINATLCRNDLRKECFNNEIQGKIDSFEIQESVDESWKAAETAIYYSA